MIKSITVNDFSKWLSDELNKREWRQTDLARKAGIGNSTLSRIMDGSRPAGPEVARKIARALGYPPEEVFREADLLPSSPLQDDNETIARLAEIVSQLPEVDQKEILTYAEYRLRKQQQGEPLENIELLTRELERLFSLLSQRERKDVLNQAAQERYARTVFEQIQKGKRRQEGAEGF